MLPRESPLGVTDAFFHVKSVMEVKRGIHAIQYNSYSMKSGNDYEITLAFTKIISGNVINYSDRND